MPPKITLRFEVDQRHVARLADHPLFKRATRRETHKLYGVYYDTPGLDLWGTGVTLMLQRAGRQWRQTVTSGGSVAAGLHQYNEFSTTIAASLPDFNALDASGIAGHFRSLELRAQFKPLLVMEFTRTTCVLLHKDGVAIEASIDRGLIRSGDATAPVSELELEVKEGPAWRAYQLAIQLLETVPLLVDDRPQMQHGIELHPGALSKPRKTPVSPLVTGMSCNVAFKALMLTCISHYIANERGMLNGADPEYLHQLRVALRRLRSVFSTFGPLFTDSVLEPPIAEIRQLAQLLGEARDWDVFVAEKLPPVLTHYANHAGLTAMTDVAAQLRRAANRRAQRAIVSTQGQGLLLALGAWISAQTWLEALDDPQRAALERPAIDYARSTLDGALTRVRKRGRDFAALSPAHLHRLRIAAKRLRYATDFFAPLFDHKEARKYRAVLARLQDALGSYNDATKMTHFAGLASRRHKGARANEARGIVFGWGAAMQHSDTRYLRRIWKELRSAQTFWK